MARAIGATLRQVVGARTQQSVALGQNLVQKTSRDHDENNFIE
jgi:hypothetical protein